jgi:hypothetical protein
MGRKMTPAQARAAIRAAQQQQKQAVNKHSREVRQYDAAVKKAVNDYNREVRSYNAKHVSTTRRSRTRADGWIRRSAVSGPDPPH